jgi:2'-hydroxyisoflavone reductase
MDLLFIGGSRFIGKHAVIEAVERGHSVTLFNRGNQPLPSKEARHIRGDRNHDLDRLAGARFDAVVDTSGYVPRQVREAATVLAGRAAAYLFISSISVYADHTRPLQDESAGLIELADPTVEEVTGETYGGLKVLCERALADAFPGRIVNVRPGVVVGPDDPTDRFTYWPVRVDRGGEVLAPSGPEVPMQWVDVRDLASFLVTLLEQKAEGTYNAVSQADRFTLGALLDACRQESGSGARATWVAEEFLLERGVAPFRDLPLWLAGDTANFARIDGSKATTEGLRIRPVEDTVRDTLRWFLDDGDRALSAGLDPARERELLSEWHELQRA